MWKGYLYRAIRLIWPLAGFHRSSALIGSADMTAYQHAGWRRMSLPTPSRSPKTARSPLTRMPRLQRMLPCARCAVNSHGSMSRSFSLTVTPVPTATHHDHRSR